MPVEQVVRYLDPSALDSEKKKLRPRADLKWASLDCEELWRWEGPEPVPKGPSQIRLGVPKSLDRALPKGPAKEKEDRCGSAEGLGRALLAILEELRD